MLTSRFNYLLLTMLLACYLWYFSPIFSFLTRDVIWCLTIILATIGIFNKKRPQIQSLHSIKYNKFVICFLCAIFISAINADIFWGQSITITFITQRFAYTIIVLSGLLKIQPTPYDLKKALKYISVITFIMWVISYISPNLFATIDTETIENRTTDNSTDIGFNVAGIQLVLIYFYILVQEYIEKFTYKKFLHAMFWLAFLFLYQNRSLLIGAILIFIYSIIKLKGRHKPIITFTIVFLVILGIYSSWDIIISLINETNEQLNNQNYNRWKALEYYLYEYSPNLWCYIWGNGLPAGGKSEFGNLLWENMKQGIYGSDLGLIGMWTDYGVIPLICIYFVVFRVLAKKYFPLFLKFICLHILIVPTIFHFWENPNMYTFVLLFYLYAYYNEKFSYECRKSCQTINNNSQL